MNEEGALASLHHQLNDQLLKETVRLAGTGFVIPLSISIGAALGPEQGWNKDTVGERSYSLLEAADRFGLCLQDTLQKVI